MQLKIIVFLVIILLLNTSCEKVVYLDLNSVNPKVVVEGNITNEPGPYLIKLSSTVNYYDNNIFPAISGAQVIIADNGGQIDTLKEITPGVYETVNLKGISGRAYFLSVTTKEGSKLHAVSEMGTSVPIDSVNFQLNLRNNTYRVTCKFTDPENVVNYYKLQAFSNNTDGLDSTNIRVLSDRLTDGQEMAISYRTRLLLGDSITVMLENIDKATYDFYRTLSNAGGDLNPFLSSPPANPLTNISNGGLGYFSAYGMSYQTKVVQ